MSARKRSAAPLVIATLVGLIAGAAGSKAATSALEKRGILSRPEMIASPPPHHKPALPPPATRPPPPSPPPPLSLVDRATRGDTTSVRQLTEKPPGERTAEETLALADAQAVDKRAQLAELARKIKLLPQFGRASSTAKIVAQFVQDRQVSTDALRMLAAIPNEIGPDLLYSIWTGAREQDDLSKWIEQLLYSKDVRAHASPALDVALDLRQVTDCDKALTILVRAKEHGDRRSLVLLNRLHNKRGCGERKLDDCFTCLRKGDELKDATVAARTRKAP